jgi:Tfp pilus assembly protein PilN
VSARRSLNLASRAFSNIRPHRRAAVLLAVVGLGLLAANAYLYGRYQTGSAEIRLQLRDIETQIEAELELVEELESALLQLDLETQNEQVSFLNERIAERAFPWSRLFDRLEEAMPSEVRLSSLTPATGERDRRRRRSGGDESVALSIEGESRGDSAMVAFVDRLFEHPSFGNPSLAQESRDGATVRFQLTVNYLPGALAPGEQGLIADEPVTAYAAPSEGADTPPRVGGEAGETTTAMRPAAGERPRELAGTAPEESQGPFPNGAVGGLEAAEGGSVTAETTSGRRDPPRGAGETTSPSTTSRTVPGQVFPSRATPPPSRSAFGSPAAGDDGEAPPSRSRRTAPSARPLAPPSTASAPPRFRGEG